MTQTVKGTIRRISFNPYDGEHFHRNVIFYLDGDTTAYTAFDIAKECRHDVIVTKPGDEVLATLRVAPRSAATQIVQWINKTFEAEQAAIAQALQVNLPAVSSSQPHCTSAVYSELFHGVMYYFANSEDLERARQADMETGLGINPFEDELDSRRIKWSTKPENLR